METHALRFIAAIIMIGGNVTMWMTSDNTVHWLIACIVFVFGLGIIIGTTSN